MFVLHDISVHRMDWVDDQGHVITDTQSLDPDSITLTPGYDAMKEDPDITSYGPIVPDQLIEIMQNMHDEQVRFLRPLGRNPCDHFRERNDERILNNLDPNVIGCPFCGRKCQNNKKLRSHYKRHRCRSAAL